jgi:YjzC-like protein
MAQEFHPGQIVPESGIYRITHDTQHANSEHEVTVIKGRRFPTCRHCQGISFELVHAAKHVGEIEHFSETEPATASGSR